jgi:tRNA (mo5U34)-methyltransferase
MKNVLTFGSGVTYGAATQIDGEPTLPSNFETRFIVYCTRGASAYYSRTATDDSNVFLDGNACARRRRHETFSDCPMLVLGLLSARHVPPHTLEQRIRELGPWFHNITLRGVQTAPTHFLGDYPRHHWERFAHVVPADLRGRTVLDVGCNAGFFALEMKRRGAARVVGIDSDNRYLAQARLAAEIMELEIEFHRLTVYEVGELNERFDLVLFLGVLYHLRHPLLALDLLHEHAVGDALIFQSMLRGATTVGAVAPDYPFAETAVFDRPDFPRLHFVERRYAGDQTNWWIPNRACAEAMLRSAGFAIVDHPVPEVFMCRTVPLASAEDDPALHVELTPARRPWTREQPQ